MRNKSQSTKTSFSVHAIGGTHVVLLSMNMTLADSAGLLGFAIFRTDKTEGTADWLMGMKRFEATDPHLAAPARYSTRDHPVQDFGWSDFTAKPNHEYEFRVLALKGDPKNLTVFDELTVAVKTESVDVGAHQISFNRGAASSQEYVRKFHDEVPNPKNGIDDPKLKWLSRGAYEAIAEFMSRAKDSTFGLRVAAYEFHYVPILKELKAAIDRGADVQIVFDAKQNGKEATETKKAITAFPREANLAAVKEAKIPMTICKKREANKADISHNKFIVLLDANKKAIAVLTGSTNYSAGGIYGQANVVHVVTDPVVAEAYHDYWKQLHGDPQKPALAKVLSQIPLPDVNPTWTGVRPIFSPRSQDDALQLYAKFAEGAKDALFMTFAFGMSKAFVPAYQNGTAPLRYALFEKLLGPGVRKEDVKAETAKMIALRKMPENLFAVGSVLPGDPEPVDALENWVAEKLTGLNDHVQFVHTKFMMVDPLGPDPRIMTGSANFSTASSVDNDENMIVIRGNPDVADVYIGEFMRLWAHYAYREFMQAKKKGTAHDKQVTGPRPGFLDPTDHWKDRHFGGTPLERKRTYLSSF